MPREANAQFAVFQALMKRLQGSCEPDNEDVCADYGRAVTIQSGASFDDIGDDQPGCAAFLEVDPDCRQVFHGEASAEAIIWPAGIAPAQGVEVNAGVSYAALFK